jgi:hypothetical protein
MKRAMIMILTALMLLTALGGCKKAGSTTEVSSQVDSSIESEAASVESTASSETATSQAASSEQSTSKTSSKKASSVKSSSTGELKPRPLNPAKLTAEQEKAICEDYLAFSIAEDATLEGYFEVRGTYINKYYGTYGDCIAIVMEPNYNGLLNRTIQVAGYQFDFKYNAIIYIYKDGEFISFDKAYEQGLIDKQAVCDIHNEMKKDPHKGVVWGS